MNRTTCLLVVAALCCLFTASQAQTLPLRINAENRCLEDQSGTPVLITADAAWGLLAYLSLPDAKSYIDQRILQGFNCGIVTMPSPNPLQPKKGVNLYGTAPWTGDPFTTPNEQYFAHADSIIDYAASKGFSIILIPAYIGYKCSSDGYGWSVEMAERTNAEMHAWGNWIGNRYKTKTNIIWSVGGDCDPTACANVRDRMLEVLGGINETAPAALMTNHNQRGTTAMDYYPGESRITLNNVYAAPSNLCGLARTAYALTPAKPFFLIEGYYEGDQYAPSEQTLRAQTYWTMLTGGCGFLFGNIVIYEYGNNFADPLNLPNPIWKSSMTTPATMHQIYARRLFTSRCWYKLVPDLAHTVVTSGYGTLDAADYCTAASASDSSSIIAYLPTQRAVTVDPSAIKGDSIRVSWYDPSAGVFASIATVSKAIREYTPPSARDWVLVIDAADVQADTLIGPMGTFQSDMTALPSGGGSVTLTWTSTNASAATIDNGIGGVALNGSMTVPVTATTTFVLTLTNANGSRTLPVQITVADPPAPTANVIYAENALTSPWSDIRSWSVTRTYGNTSPVYSGATSAKIVHNAWASLQFSQGNWGSFTSISPAPYQSLDCMINGGTTSFTMRVNCLDAAGRSILTPVSFTVPANTWTVKSIPMSQLTTVPFTAIQYAAGGSNVTFYLDNISLILKPTDPPALPVLSSPVNGAVNQPVSPTLAWSPAAAATSYQLQVSADSLFSSLFVNDSTLTGTTRAIGPCAYSTKYFWRVQARNASGKSAFTAAWNFTTMPMPKIDPPAAPKLLAPANGALAQPVAVTLRWNKALAASVYRVQVASDPLFAAPIVDDSTLTDTSKTVSALDYASRYYWRVRAAGAGGVGEFSAAWNFTTGSLPAVPVLSSPANNAADVAVTQTLAWSAADNAASYHVQLARDSLFAVLVLNDSACAGSSRTTGTLTGGISYFWRVRSQNAIGKSAFSAPWKFSTAAPPPQTINVIYQESALTPPWNDIRSWSVTRTYTSKSPVFQGSTSASIVHSAWASLQFSQGTWGGFTSLNPTAYQSFDFAAHGGTTGVTLQVSCVNAAGRNIFAPVLVSVPANTWQAKSIPMSQLANAPFVAIAMTAGGSKVTFSLDNLGLVYTTLAKSGAHAQAVPDAFALEQNYPNPFNPSTTIRYALPQRSRVKIEIYTVLGQLVDCLVDRECDAGVGEVVWNAGVTSGMYFFTLEAVPVDNPAGRYREMKKMILLK